MPSFDRPIGIEREPNYIPSFGSGVLRVFLPLIFVLAAQSVDRTEYSCAGTDTTLDCRGPDGSTYIERKLGDNRLIRKGTASDGRTWVEYVTRQFDGTRTQGEDSSGKTWFQQCSARFGTTGTDRNGNPVSRPPRYRRPPQPGDTNRTPEPHPCD